MTENKDDEESASSADGGDSDDNSNIDNRSSNSNKSKRIQALEAKAVAEATATADAQYVPSLSLMNSNDPLALLRQVDGLSDLTEYEEKESVYVGRSVPITAGGSLEIPIQVATPGSVVEYAVENKQYDFGFSITAERDESVTLVKVGLSIYLHRDCGFFCFAVFFVILFLVSSRKLFSVCVCLCVISVCLCAIFYL